MKVRLAWALAPAFVLVAASLSFSLLRPVAAGGLTVNTLIDENDGSCIDGDCSLRDAVAVAAAGDTITFDASIHGGTIILSGTDIDIAKDLTIEGPGADQLTISGNNASRIFDITSGTVFISGLTFTGGKSAGASGGAIRLAAGANLIVLGSTFTGNESHSVVSRN